MEQMRGVVIQIEQDLKEGYIETFADYYDTASSYSAAQVEKRIAELEAKKI